MRFITIRTEKEKIEEDFSVFMRRFDNFDKDKKEFKVADILSVYPKDTNYIVLGGLVIWKDMIRGWIPDEKTLVFKCQRSMREYEESLSPQI